MHCSFCVGMSSTFRGELTAVLAKYFQCVPVFECRQHYGHLVSTTGCVHNKRKRKSTIHTMVCFWFLLNSCRRDSGPVENLDTQSEHHVRMFVLFTTIPHPHGHWHLQALLGSSSYHIHPRQVYLLQPDLPNPDLT